MQKLYIRLRRRIRHTVQQTRWTDRVLGDRLRWLEKRLRVYEGWLNREGQLTVHDLKLNYRAEDRGVANIVYLNGYYEPETEAVLRELLQSGDVFLDLGAHIGYFTLLAAQLVRPNGHVYAFEPNPATFNTLQRNVAENNLTDLVTTVPKAISDAEKLVTFSISARDTVSAKIETDARFGADILELESTSVDSYFQLHSVQRVRLIKMDIEGAELSALQGLENTIKANPTAHLIIEFNLPHMMRSNVSTQIFMGAIRTCGFNYYKIMKSGYNTKHSLSGDFTELEELAKRMTINLLCSVA